MKNYDPNIRMGRHKIKITLQCWDYVGHVIHEIGGNCKGLNILMEADFTYRDFEDCENDCNLQFHDDGYEVFTVVLKNENGDTLEIQEDGRGMNDMIVAVEILDFVKE